MSAKIRYRIIRVFWGLSLSVIFSACGGSPQDNNAAPIDTTPPVLTVPPDIITGNNSYSYIATASDLVGGAITPVCAPASPISFTNYATTTVTCTATDASHNSSSATFTVTYALRGTTNSMDIYINSMAPKQWKLWTTGTDGGFLAALLPRTRANFDGHGTGANGTWASDTEVGSAPMKGVGGANGIWAYSAPAINSNNGDVCIRGGGHVDGGDGSIYCLNLTAGPSVSWALKVPSERYIPASEPKPTWSHSNTPLPGTDWGQTIANGISGGTTISVTNATFIKNGMYINVTGGGGGIPNGTKIICSGTCTSSLTLSNPLTANLSSTSITWTNGYWPVENKNGVKLPTIGHPYFNTIFDESSDVLYLSSSGGFDANAGGNTQGDAFAYQPSLPTNNGIHGPFYISANTGVPYNKDSSYGYGQSSSNGEATVCSNDLDGKLYTYGYTTTPVKTYLWRIESALTAPYYVVAAPGGDTSYDVRGAYTNCVIFPDPIGGSTKRAYFAKTTSGLNTYVLFNDISGNSTFHGMTWTNGFPNTESGYLSFDYNTDQNKMAMTDGADIWEFSFDSSGAASAFDKITEGSTGDIPATNGDAYHFARLQYFPAPYYSYVMCNYKQCSVFRRE